MPDTRIPIVILTGSVRPGNYTLMAARLVLDELNKSAEVAAELIDAANLDLPLPGRGGDHPDAVMLREKVSSAAAVILATPEYHGSFSSVMKLIIENLGFPSALRGKPVALLGVAAGAIGAIKSLEQLRGVVAHVGAIALPLPVSVANVQKVFDAEGRIHDPAVEKYVRRTAANVVDYLKQHVCPAMTLERILREGA
ncbi:MAG: NAD(P)H-dependent oxidoreductase [Bryobacterales bacterium]|nr:NAD(P)H-dependent oxidoreductase [Bryobacterales bacterium]